MKKLILPIVLILAAAAIYLLYPRAPQNVILITIDTLRADHLGVYGYARPTSPELDARSAKAQVFERAIVQWPKTVPSMTSMFTSTYAHTNGVMFASRGQYIDDSLTTITEVLKANGFETYGVVSNAVLSHSTNFSQGFDHYAETWLDASRGPNHSRADHVTDFAIKALNELKGKKFFLWIHYVDPHYQYFPPAPFNRMFIGDHFYRKNRILKINAEDANYYDGIARRVWNLDQSQEWDYYIAQYDAEIRYLDHELQRLFSKFDQDRIWKTSVVYFTADHGESLGENHYYFEHGWFPYTACSHVPLIVWDPQEKARRISTSTALLDLAPSILRRMKIPIPAAFEGKPWDTVNARPIYVEAGEGGLTRQNFTRSMWIWPFHFVYVPSLNYQRMMQHMPFELYNVEKDPYEARNIVEQDPQRAKDYEKQLFKWMQSSPNFKTPSSKTPDYDPQAIEQMESLGYVQ